MYVPNSQCATGFTDLVCLTEEFVQSTVLVSRCSSIGDLLQM